ncbi:MAG: hypothetical protein AABW67_03635, partial [Nanoarchaeota archaeon]
MTIDSLKQNIKRMREIIREIYIFDNQKRIIENLEKNDSMIDTQEKKLLSEVVRSLMIQLRILNNSIPELIKTLGFFRRLNT